MAHAATTDSPPHHLQIVDDCFAFVIKMPTLHRLSVFRDDLVFAIYIYQRWIYRVDKKRANEFGYGPHDSSLQLQALSRAYSLIHDELEDMSRGCHAHGRFPVGDFSFWLLPCRYSEEPAEETAAIQDGKKESAAKGIAGDAQAAITEVQDMALHMSNPSTSHIQRQ